MRVRRRLRVRPLRLAGRPVPRQNRVTPFGDIVRTAARGLLFGNRGVLHDEREELIRSWQVRRWIACRLRFKDWHREPMPPGRYTGLFFLDEATALAAGHRPCAECRREDFLRFRDAWAAARGAAGGVVRADDVDRVLHAERLAPGGVKRAHRAQAGALVDGAMVEVDGGAWLVLGEEILSWSPFGYGERRARPHGWLQLLTPPSTVAAVGAGYGTPMLHPSAASTTS